MKKRQKISTVTATKSSSYIPLAIGVVAIVGMLALLFTLVSLRKETDVAQAATPSLNTDAQQISMVVTASSYEPSTLTVEAGKAVQWNVDGSRSAGCTTYLVSPTLGISKKLNKGPNVIEFMAPTEKGTYGFQCSMGMVKGTMNVI